ncbi:MAG: glycoside hydrolase family 3 N-terminal domain-containing protein [Hyphomicrobiales bacterium]
MTVESQLLKPPFSLRPEDLAWVRKTRDAMSTADKIRQLFVHINHGDSLEGSKRFAALRPGGLHRFMGADLEAAWRATRAFMEACEVPPLITADLEGGGHHSSCFTASTNQLGMAAANDPALSEKLVDALAREASAMGFNVTFTPCIDMNVDTGSAIVGTRSYGQRQDVISAQALAHMRAMQRNGIAATAKHWPGEGLDWRDQHMVTTINPLVMEDWHKSFGALYKGLIDGGLLCAMSAHIALPDHLARQGVPEGLERYRPASISKHLNFGLLRGDLGFNGLIVSDATPMAGLRAFSARARHVPEVIENGCDIFLFCAGEEADISHMENGLRSGALSEQRLEDAVTRILGLKAALGLHRKTLDERILPLEQVREIVRAPAHVKLAREVAEKSVTCVKDVDHLLPLNVARHRRICWIGKGAPGFLPGQPPKQADDLRAGLTARGFAVSDFDPANPPTPETADLVLYVMCDESSLGKMRIFLNWRVEQEGLGNMMSRYWHDIPTVLVSFGHPYYLQDAPRAPCCINAYAPVADAQAAVLERLTGNAAFSGVSPVDVFAGAPDARY